MIIKDLINAVTKYYRLKGINEAEKQKVDSKVLLFNTIESAEVGSNKIMSWSLSIIVGSLLVILNTSYIKPKLDWFKYFYSLFAVGWVLIGISIYFGRKITNSKIAAILNRKSLELLDTILKDVNNYYHKQLVFFYLSLMVFGFWLFTYLFYWLLGDKIRFFIN